MDVRLSRLRQEKWVSPGAVVGDGSTANILLEAILAASRGREEGLHAGIDETAGLLELVDVVSGQVVHQAGAPIQDVFFPLSAVFGLMTVTVGAPKVEAMAVGFEGVVGLAAVLGDGTSPHQALCQVPGQALRLSAEVLRGLADTDVRVRGLLGQHVQAAVVLLSQRVACSQRHTAEQRCADWLLRQAERIGANSIPVTQQFLASMLGLRRTTVSAVDAQLRQAGLISYRYGRLSVRDAAGLQLLACSCYRVFRDQSDRLVAAAGVPTEQHGSVVEEE